MVTTFRAFAGSLGHTLSSLEWLLLHHRAKEAARRRCVENLPLFPGMDVVDLGCGPGLWTNLLAEQIAPHGSVLGIDLDANLIKYAREHADEVTGLHPQFEVRDFNDLDAYEQRFDVAFSSNCFVYYEAAEPLVRKFSRVVKPGGIMILRHFDNSFWIANPIEPSLSAAVFHWAAMSGRQDPQGHYFNNSLGQGLHRICREAGLSDVRTYSTTVDLSGPLSQAGRDYLSLTAEWTAKIAEKHADPVLLQQWLAHFDPRSEAYVLDDPDCHFTFLDFVVTGFVGDSH